jgi:hypothetical protein
MSAISSLNNLSSSYLQSIISNTLQSTNSTASSSSSASASSATAPSESSQLSPFAQLMSTLQQLQQSNPAEYKQVTQQIATNLQTAAQTATTDGNSTQAQLSQLATDFTNASQSGQLPNMQDLAQAIGGGHHHHHGHAASTDADISSSSPSNSASTSPLSQLLAQFQVNNPQSESLNPMSIITNTLSRAGINISSNG